MPVRRDLMSRWLSSGGKKSYWIGEQPAPDLRIYQW
jgi:hypothetical protein|tara:strand:+ start:1336 stop:1443 length:108 start_codon:yes stop_codon:yes gene_type:complete